MHISISLPQMPSHAMEIFISIHSDLGNAIASYLYDAITSYFLCKTKQNSMAKYAELLVYTRGLRCWRFLSHLCSRSILASKWFTNPYDFGKDLFPGYERVLKPVDISHLIQLNMRYGALEVTCILDPKLHQKLSWLSMSIMYKFRLQTAPRNLVSKMCILTCMHIRQPYTCQDKVLAGAQILIYCFCWTHGTQYASHCKLWIKLIAKSCLGRKGRIRN